MIEELNTKEYYILLSLGSNIGDRKANILQALKYINESETLSAIKVSSFYETEPVGYTDQDWFLNIAVSGYTSLPLYQLIQQCKSIEYALGRELRERWHEREIDIDILLYGDKKLHETKITVPHPRMHERRFVLEPAAEIAGNEIHPEFGVSINKLLAECNDDSRVRMAV